MAAGGWYLWADASEQERLIAIEQEHRLARDAEDSRKLAQKRQAAEIERRALSENITAYGAAFGVALRTPKESLGVVLLRVSDTRRALESVPATGCFTQVRYKLLRLTDWGDKFLNRVRLARGISMADYEAVYEELDTTITYLTLEMDMVAC